MEATVPLYVLARDAMLRDIATGTWIVGQKIPKLDDLAIQHGVHRDTVRKALGLLLRQGYLRRCCGPGGFEIHLASNQPNVCITCGQPRAQSNGRPA